METNFSCGTLSIRNPKMIGEWLVELGLIAKRQLDHVVSLQGESPGLRLGELLIRKGFITREELERTLEIQQLLMGEQDLKDLPPSPQVLGLVPEAFAIEHRVLPLARVGLRLLVGLAEPPSAAVLDRIAERTGLIVIPIVLPRDPLMSALEQSYGCRLRPAASAQPAPISASSAALRILASRASGASDAEPAVRELVGAIFEEAVRLQASDVHVCPSEAAIEIRFRIDGVLSKQLELPMALESAIGRYFRQQAGEAAGALCQALELTVSGAQFVGWLSCLPTGWGERWKIRLTPKAAPSQGLDLLPMDPYDLSAFSQLIQARHGLILMVGPKRLNRTNLLHSSLRFLDRHSNNMMMLDDADAAPIPGVATLRVNGHPALNTERAIELALRQDADVLLVNELETRAQVEAASRACLEGSLVIATMAAPDVGAALSRLQSLGVHPALLAANLKGVVARVLVRRNCPECAVEYEADSEERAFLGVEAGVPLALVRGLGCAHCHDTGYAGQIGIFEIMPVTASIKRLLADQGPSFWHLEHVPYTLLVEDARRKVSLGYTRHAEIIRAFGEAARKRPGHPMAAGVAAGALGDTWSVP